MNGMKAFGVALLAALLLAAPMPSVHAGAVGPARILIAGDSVTQGKVGDYTWRYRLWNTLEAAGANVDFVGPLTGLAGPSGTTNVQGYADPNFDQDHAARWGAALVTGGWWSNDGLGTYVTKDLAATYQPDVVIDDLGINNLAWYGQAPQTVIDLQAAFVADVRSVDPTATVVLGQLSQSWDAGVPAYNDLLTSLAASLDQQGARVIVAQAPSNYVEGVDTYDATHPSASGEVKLAAPFADALREVGIGIPPTPSPPAVVGAGHLVAVARRAGRVRLTWTTPAGATAQEIYVKRVGSDHWRALSAVTSASSRIVVRLHRHAWYAFRMRATNSPTYSNRVRVRTR